MAKRAVVAGVKAATLGILDVEEAVETMVSDAAGEMAGDLVDAFHKEKAALEKFREEIEKAIEQVQASGKKGTLIFFIDELDRCRPTFAIEMLERIKHLFDVPNIVFVLSVDKSQLEASTAAVYGERINAAEYLRRFIDLEYGIPVVAAKGFTRALLARSGLEEAFNLRHAQLKYEKDQFTDFFTSLANVTNLSLRARERCITRVCVVLEQTPTDQYLEPILVAVLVVLRTIAPQLYGSLVGTTSSATDVMEYFSRLPGGQSFVEGRIGVVLETYLIVCDTDRGRTEMRLKELAELAADADNVISQNRAKAILDTRTGMFRGFHEPPDLRHVAKKVDLAALFRE